MSDDLISRQAAIDALKDVSEHYTDKGREWHPHVDFMVEAIQDLPSAQPERKKGKWKRHNTYRGDDTSGYVDPDWRCSECGKRANINECFMYDLTDFCPNCGADMREG